MPHDMVTQTLTGTVAAAVDARFAARLEYRAADPFAVRMVFEAGCTAERTPTTWTFARHLLLDGLLTWAGRGDVRVRPHGRDRTALELRTRGDCTVLLVRTAEIRSFLAASQRIVPPGTEGRMIDWTRELAELTRDG
ncbi:SsgA family sporulation/cell division regulator [Kitasatospora sp. NPDC096147]|uniref:SsgA family sporulation/cell division regulator n=1 Tax=Kitasatospora sp. NPDC096147 TaxID=3364093 RepID=UPI003822D8F9